MCFNNAKNWQLAWYNDKHYTWSGTTTTIELVGLSDYSTTGSESKVSITVHFVFVCD